MIPLGEGIWIGNSHDGERVGMTDITAVLNVAQDLVTNSPELLWPEIEYAKVGLIDGPGNPPSAYSSAVLMLHTLLLRCEQVLVLCHNGGRSMAVVLIYRIIKAGNRANDMVTFMSCWTPWDKMLATISADSDHCYIPPIHPAHKEAFDRLPLALLEQLI